MTDNWLERTELLLGAEKLEKLRAAHVLVVGLGGVGAYAAEMIVRAGVGRMTVADADTVNPTNINRQLVALHSTVGRPKAEVLAERLRDINPTLELHVVDKYIKDEETDLLLDSARFDYAVDAIDTLSPKLALILGALKRGIPLVSSMGAGAKTDPTRLEIEDISRTHHTARGQFHLGLVGQEQLRLVKRHAQVTQQVRTFAHLQANVLRELHRAAQPLALGTLERHKSVLDVFNP